MGHNRLIDENVAKRSPTVIRQALFNLNKPFIHSLKNHKSFIFFSVHCPPPPLAVICVKDADASHESRFNVRGLSQGYETAAEHGGCVAGVDSTLIDTIIQS